MAETRAGVVLHRQVALKGESSTRDLAFLVPYTLKCCVSATKVRWGVQAFGKHFRRRRHHRRLVFWYLPPAEELSEVLSLAVLFEQAPPEDTYTAVLYLLVSIARC